jgi:hypothetical protein
MVARSKRWLAERIPVRSKHWFAVATLWLAAVAILLAPNSWRWS